eukprot:6320996-Amphidinium_carterae.2
MLLRSNLDSSQTKKEVCLLLSCVLMVSPRCAPLLERCSSCHLFQQAGQTDHIRQHWNTYRYTAVTARLPHRADTTASGTDPFTNFYTQRGLDNTIGYPRWGE